ncbi:unnamed protein product, partial [Polarella glacialis]
MSLAPVASVPSVPSVARSRTTSSERLLGQLLALPVRRSSGPAMSAAAAERRPRSSALASRLAAPTCSKQPQLAAPVASGSTLLRAASRAASGAEKNEEDPGGRCQASSVVKVAGGGAGRSLSPRARGGKGLREGGGGQG